MCSESFFIDVGKEKSKKMTCDEAFEQCSWKYRANLGSLRPNYYINRGACENFKWEQCEK
jgi:hypothetical protein